MLGAEAITKDPVGFARIQWDTWSSAGWYDEPTFLKVAESFKNPDWVAITLNGYRSRFIWAASDPDYAELKRQVAVRPQTTVPTLMIRGGADACDPPRNPKGWITFLRPLQTCCYRICGTLPHPRSTRPGCR